MREYNTSPAIYVYNTLPACRYLRALCLGRFVTWRFRSSVLDFVHLDLFWLASASERAFICQSAESLEKWIGQTTEA